MKKINHFKKKDNIIENESFSIIILNVLENVKDKFKNIIKKLNKSDTIILPELNALVDKIFLLERQIRLFWEDDSLYIKLKNILEINSKKLVSFNEKYHKQIINLCIEKWCLWSIIKFLDQIKDFEYNEFIANILIKEKRYEELFELINKFESIDVEWVVNKIINNRDLYKLLNYIDKNNLLNQEIVINLLISKWEIVQIVDNLIYFDWLSFDIALILIKNWYWNKVQERKNIFKDTEIIYEYLKKYSYIVKNVFIIFYELYKKNDKKGLNNLYKEINLWINQIINWEKLNIKISWILESDICFLVYKKWDYSPKNIDLYNDETNHLNNFKFDRNWYRFSLNNLLWYKLKNWENMNVKLLEDFEKIFKYIEEISKNELNIKNYIYRLSKNYNLDIKSEKIEWQILEYLVKKQEIWNLNIYDFNIILAYQLLWEYDMFGYNLKTKLDSFVEDVDSNYMIKMLAYLEQYWDVFRETIKSIKNKVLESEDKKYIENYTNKLKNEINSLTKPRIINNIIKSYINRPQEKITKEIIIKSIVDKFKLIFQENNLDFEKIENFALLFDIEDFKFWEDLEKQELFRDKWINNIIKIFWNSDNIWFDLSEIINLQNSIYNQLQFETNKFEQLTEKWWKNKVRKVFARFWKSKYDSCARWVWYICLWTDENMWENKGYFELVLFDEDRKINIWTVMLLDMKEPNWKKYLLFWPNPSAEFNDKVSSKILFEKISKIIINFAKDNNYDWVVFDSTHWRSTNRSWDFQKALENSQLKDENKFILLKDLINPYTLWKHEDFLYEYKCNLSYLWKKW